MRVADRLTGLSIERFESNDISPEAFDHAAHVYIAWLFVQAFPLGTAMARFDAALRRLVVTLDAHNKYHATITGFFILLIAERSITKQAWHEFCAANTELVGDPSTILNRYYSAATLSSMRAKTQFVLPDKALQAA